ncbi:hypothetical protein GCM10010269_34620 [Streptomyces humidus]|uniref:Uncharacterized protein n=1 Tax=Streptomyces humidus TaxID=52259 RepID=A0A918L3M8_9ACTN|nr:hypothetical protein GCM10010269_34620 [Streptomyces humidus]
MGADARAGASASAEPVAPRPLAGPPSAGPTPAAVPIDETDTRVGEDSAGDADPQPRKDKKGKKG